MQDKLKLNIYRIKNQNDLELSVSNYGATILELGVLDKNGNIVNVCVGLKDPEQYMERAYQDHEIHLGGSIGRYAGRLSEPLIIDNRSYDIYAPEGVHLHGGRSGFDRKYWHLVDIDNGKIPSMTLSYESPHLEEGYPGNLRVSVTYTLTPNNGLDITYKAETDQTTMVNLTNHAYFNLNGYGTILDHVLQISSVHHLEVGDNRIPTGQVLDNKQSSYDFLEPRQLSEFTFKGLDDTFILNDNTIKASLHSPSNGIKMDVYTDQPALVVFTPKAFPQIPLSSNYEKFPAICFEAQNYPDAPKHTHFPSPWLKKGALYQNATKLRFTIV